MSILNDIKSVLSRKIQDNSGWIRQGKISVGKNLKDLANDSEGWFRQGKFTPVQQYKNIQQKNNQNNLFRSFGPIVTPNFQNKNLVNALSNQKRTELPTINKGGVIPRAAYNYLVKPILESNINIPRNLSTGTARIVKEFQESKDQKRKINPNNIIGGVLPLAEGAFDLSTLGLSSVGKGIAKSAAKNVTKDSLIKIIGKGALKSAPVGFLGGSSMEIDNQYGKKQDTSKVLKSGLSGALITGILGGTIAGGSAAWEKGVGEITKKIIGIKPKISPQEARKEAVRYIQLESGRLAGSKPKYKSIDDVKFVGDLRESIGLSRNGDEIPQLGQSTRNLTKEEHLASQPIKTGGIKQPTIKIKGQSNLESKQVPQLELSGKTQNKPKLSQPTQKSLSSSEGIVPQDLVNELSGSSVGNPKSIFKESGATLTKKQYETKKVATLKLQSENARKAQNEANDYFKSISTPAYKKGTVNLGDQLPADELLRATKDKMAFGYQRETIQRNIEEIFGKDSKMSKYISENITNNENQSVNFQNTLRNKLATVFKQTDIKKGSKEDYAAADFIEGTLTLDQLKKEFPNKWQGIVKASEEGRAVYKELLNKINTTLKRFGYEPIPERQNYVTHTNQIQTLSERIGSLTNLSSDELPRAMAGINLETKPGRKFFSFGLQRQGGSTHEGLITALDRYIPSASRQIFHTEDIQRGRAILNFLQKSANEGDTRLSGFTSYFSQFVDHLAGKQNIIDRPIEKIFGRKFLAIGDWVRKRTGANMVGANLSSAATNFIPFTQSAATTSKPAFARGLLQSVLNIGKEPSVIDGVQSGFLLRRFAKERITGTLGENIKDTASLPFKLVDKFTSTSIVAGKYFEQLAKGLSKEKAMALADDYAQRVMADRSFAQSPLLFNSKTLGALTQFQLEVNNQISFLMKDIPKNLGYSKAQVASSLVQFAVYSYLFNDLYEKAIGRRPQIDPIQAVMTTSEGLQNGEGIQAFNPISKTGTGFSDQTGTGQILNQLPFTSIGSGRIPITSAFKQPQYYLLPPFGGGQIKKTIEGLNTYNKGYSETKKGQVRFPVEKSTGNLIKLSLFGQYSTSEAREYFSKNRSVLGEKQSEKLKNSINKIEDYNKIIQEREQNAIIDKAKEEVKKTGIPKKVGEIFLYPSQQFDSETGQMKDIVKSVDMGKQIPKLELTGQKELDKKLVSSYKSAITSKISDITNLYKLGQISAEEAERQIKELKKLQSSVSSSSKSKKKVSSSKITIKKVSLPTFKTPSFAKIGASTTTIKKPNIKLSTPKKIVVASPKTKSNTIKISRLPTMKVAKGGFLG